MGAQFACELKQLKETSPRQNPKGELQELLQARSASNPQYRVIRETGPDHHKHFEAAVEWEGREIGRGTGASKRTAAVGTTHATRPAG